MMWPTNLIDKMQIPESVTVSDARQHSNALRTEHVG
jgi:hypothetical protein